MEKYSQVYYRLIVRVLHRLLHNSIRYSMWIAMLQLDVDRSGSISVEELRGALARKGLTGRDAQVPPAPPPPCPLHASQPMSEVTVLFSAVLVLVYGTVPSKDCEEGKRNSCCAEEKTQ